MERSYMRPTIGDRDKTVSMRQAQAAVQHCDTTPSLQHETGKNAAETQEKSVETETESRGRVPSKCQALYKSALMEELCFQESTECSPAKCTWLALHTQTRAHLLMRGWRRSRAGPLHEARGVPRAMCNVMKSNSTVQLRKKKWWSIHDERTPDTRPTYWDWSVYSRLDTQMTVCRLFVNVGLRLSVKKSAFPQHRVELYIRFRNLYFLFFKCHVIVALWGALEEHIFLILWKCFLFPSISWVCDPA